MAGRGLAVALLRAHLKEAALPAQDEGLLAARAPEGPSPNMRRYVGDWVVWVQAGAERAARGARQAYNVLVDRLEACGMRLDLTKTGVVASTAAALAAERGAFCGLGGPGRGQCEGPRGGRLLGEAAPAHAATEGWKGPPSSGPAESVAGRGCLPGPGGWRADGGGLDFFFFFFWGGGGGGVDGRAPTTPRELRNLVHKALVR